MGREELGRVVNPEALESAAGVRVRLEVEIPTTWLESKILVDLPRRLLCARCEGGGCDTCERKGGVRLPEELVGTQIVAPLPKELGDKLGDAIEVRLPEPFGPDGPVNQLLLRIRRGMAATPGVHRPLRPMTRVRRVRWRDVAVYGAIALIPILAMLSALFVR